MKLADAPQELQIAPQYLPMVQAKEGLTEVEKNNSTRLIQDVKD